MPNYLYKEVTVNGVAHEETVKPILVGTEEERYHIVSVCFTEVTGSLQGDATLRAYVEREKILDISYKHLLENSGSNTRLPNQWIELDRELGAGKTLAVGHVSGGTASDFKVAVKYEVIK